MSAQAGCHALQFSLLPAAHCMHSQGAIHAISHAKPGRAFDALQCLHLPPYLSQEAAPGRQPGDGRRGGHHCSHRLLPTGHHPAAHADEGDDVQRPGGCGAGSWRQAAYSWGFTQQGWVTSSRRDMTHASGWRSLALTLAAALPAQNRSPAMPSRRFPCSFMLLPTLCSWMRLSPSGAARACAAFTAAGQPTR